jgi:tRNA 2-thiouridine synthesizing protein E
MAGNAAPCLDAAMSPQAWVLPGCEEEQDVMAIEFDGGSIATTATGYLEDHNDGSQDLARRTVELEGIELAHKHWDVPKYLRDELFGNNEHQPNTRTIVKAMSEQWGEAVDHKRLYDLISRRSLEAGRPYRRPAG